jgi:hypothetical protein
MRPRGNAQQLMEKFLAMARDASAMGDRVAAENYFQHADHYYRVLNARFEAQQQQQQQNQNQNGGYYNNGQRHQNNRFDRQGYQGEGQGDEGQGDQQNFQRGAYEARPSYDQRSGGGGNYQGGYQNQNDAGRSYENQAQPEAEQPTQQAPAYQPQPARAPTDSDIGLPPQILGLEDNGSESGGHEESQADSGGEGRSPRRRRGRGHGGRHPNAGE